MSTLGGGVLDFGEGLSFPGAGKRHAQRQVLLQHWVGVSLKLWVADAQRGAWASYTGPVGVGGTQEGSEQIPGGPSFPPAEKMVNYL